MKHGYLIEQSPEFKKITYHCSYKNGELYGITKVIFKNKICELRPWKYGTFHGVNINTIYNYKNIYE